MGRLSRDEARRLIHEAGLRATAPRVAVLRLLHASTRPLSHSEVVDALGATDWDPATLYRNLLKLVEASLARVASRVGGVARYEARAEGDGPHVHPHFTCRTCGTVTCLPEARLAGPIGREWHQPLAEAELQLLGECPACLDGTGPARPNRP